MGLKSAVILIRAATLFSHICGVAYFSLQEVTFHRFRFSLHLDGSSVFKLEIRIVVISAEISATHTTIRVCLHEAIQWVVYSFLNVDVATNILSL